MKPIIALIAGLLFGLGLAISGMANPYKVQNFLDLAGHWDPSLALVMAAALAITTPGFWLLRRRERAFSGDAMPTPANGEISRPLLIGSALFGIGWGLAGYCPGPAVGNLAFVLQDALQQLGGNTSSFSSLNILYFIIAMLAGSQLARLIGTGKT
ncbi:hypothetical protein CO610_09455 [Lysobacteraceae bacterium NML95-0200]|nr:hypothetical protein CO610_09455 [Xanthomonadaceae bacterium NML95-0200]